MKGVNDRRITCLEIQGSDVARLAQRRYIRPFFVFADTTELTDASIADFESSVNSFISDTLWEDLSILTGS